MFELSQFSCGNASLPPLIFIHGFMGCKEDWEEIIPFFANRYHCIAIDLPGHGDTPYSDDIIGTLKRWIPSMTKGKPILIGYSMGGRIAMHLSELAQVIVNISGHPGLTTEKEKEERVRIDAIWEEKLLTLPFEAFFIEWYAQPIFQPFPENIRFLQNLVKRRMRQNPKNLASVLKQLSLGRQQCIEEFACPALFMHGENDLKYREIFSRLRPTITVRQIKNCGHALHLENVALCSKTILNWLGEIHANA